MARLTPRKPRKSSKSDQVAGLQDALARLASTRLEIHIDLGDVGPAAPEDYQLHTQGLAVDDNAPYVVRVRWPSKAR